MLISSLQLSYETDLKKKSLKQTKLFEEQCSIKEKYVLSISMSIYKTKNRFFKICHCFSVYIV